MEPSNLAGTFEQRARAFCAALEGCFGTGPEALRNIRDVLLRLYASALVLSLPPESGVDLPEDEERIREQRSAIVQRLETASFQDPFWVMFYPLNLEQPAPVTTTLSDGLGDIWCDLKPGLQALDKDRPRYQNGVVWDWTFSFQTHWGRHAIDAIRAIHFQLQDME